ncbi:MAG: dephospho-CoA kinase [Bacilli bacterium]
MWIIGLTGGIATGKTTVTALFREEHVPIVDADVIAREIVAPGMPALKEIVLAFGEAMLNPDGTLNRPALGAVVFSSEKQRHTLNRIMHPKIRDEMKRQIREHEINGASMCILDVPLLFENHLEGLVDEVVVVYTNETTQRERLMKRNAFSEEEANKRIRSQMAIEEKKKRADVIIDNSGTIEETKMQFFSYFQKKQNQQKKSPEKP